VLARPALAGLAVALDVIRGGGYASGLVFVLQ